MAQQTAKILIALAVRSAAPAPIANSTVATAVTTTVMALSTARISIVKASICASVFRKSSIALMASTTTAMVLPTVRTPNALVNRDAECALLRSLSASTGGTTIAMAAPIAMIRIARSSAVHRSSSSVAIAVTTIATAGSIVMIPIAVVPRNARYARRSRQAVRTNVTMIVTGSSTAMTVIVPPIPRVALARVASSTAGTDAMTIVMA